MGTRTRTVMFTDLKDYTKAVEDSSRQGIRDLLLQHEELVAPKVRKYHGRVVKNLGDSYMCFFDSATDGLRAALEIQDLGAHASEISIRLALTTGDVEEIGDDGFGPTVNRAARILGKTPAGDIWFGPGTRVCMNASEIPWESVGRFRMKGLPEEIDVYRAVPAHRCRLPDPVSAAARHRRLVVLRRGDQVPSKLPTDPIVLLEGFLPGSAELARVLGQLPVLDPARLFLGTYHISPADRAVWLDAGRGLVIGTPHAVDAAVREAEKPLTRSTGSDTIVLDVGARADLELVIAGLALPSVPLADVVAGYAYDLLPDGRWVNQSDRAVLRIEVSPEGPRVRVTSPGVSIDGRARSPDDVVVLDDGTRIGANGTEHVYRTLDQDYVGAILSDTRMRLGVTDGQTAEVGREPGHPGLAFPERRGPANLRWCSGNRASRARAGGFTLDRALAGRRQAAISVSGPDLQITPLHQRCVTWLLEGDARTLTRVDRATPAALGDHLVAGTTVVGFRAPTGDTMG